MWLSSSNVRLKVELLGEDLGLMFTGLGARGIAVFSPASVVMVDELVAGL